MIQRSYLNQNQIQRLELNHNDFDNPMTILTPKNYVNTPKIIQFLYKLILPHPCSIRLSNYFLFVIYLNILKILVLNIVFNKMGSFNQIM